MNQNKLSIYLVSTRDSIIQRLRIILNYQLIIIQIFSGIIYVDSSKDELKYEKKTFLNI